MIRRSFRSLAVVPLLILSALSAGCQRENPPIPPTSQNINRALMSPDSEAKVRSLLSLTEESRKDNNRPAMRKTLDAALPVAEKLDDPVVKAELLTKITEFYVTENWEKESYNAITAARLAAQTIPDLSKKIAALTELALALHRGGDQITAKSMIADTENTIAGVLAPELRVPLLASLGAACAKINDPKSAEKYLPLATELAATIKDPVKRTMAEVNAASACFRAERSTEGKAFYQSALKSAEAITDPATKAKTLLDLVDILHPFRSQLAIETPLAEAVKAAGMVADAKEKEALLKRAADLPKLPSKDAPAPQATASASKP